MLEFLCKVYPHLAFTVLNKMSYSAITSLRKNSPTIEKFFTNEKRLHCHNYIDITEEDGILKYFDEDESYCCKELLMNSQWTNVFLETVWINGIRHCHKELMNFLRNVRPSIACSYLSMDVHNAEQAIDLINFFHPETLTLRIFEFNINFLQNHVFRKLNQIIFQCINKFHQEKGRIKLAGLKLRRLAQFDDHFFEDEVMEMVQGFLEGKPTIRRFVAYSRVDPNFYKRFIIKFNNNITFVNHCSIKKQFLNPSTPVTSYYGYLGISSPKEEAFVLIEKNRFLFRCVKKSNKHILHDYFRMEPTDNTWLNFSKFILPDIDEVDAAYDEED